MKSNQQRLNNIIGQVEGVKKMIDNQADCIKILTQLKAIKAAVAGVMDTIVDNKIETCMKSVKMKDKKLLIQMKTYVKSN